MLSLWVFPSSLSVFSPNSPFPSETALIGAVRERSRKRCQWHMAFHCAKHSFKRQVHQSLRKPERMQTPDGWLFGLTCCSYITSETQVPPQAHDTGKLQTAKYSVRHIVNGSQVRGKIINKLFKPCARNPGSGLCRPITAQHLSYRGNTRTTSE